MTDVNYEPKDINRINKISNLMLPSTNIVDGKKMLLTEVAEASLVHLAQWFNEDHFLDVSPELHNAIEEFFTKIGWTEEDKDCDGEIFKRISSKIIGNTEEDEDQDVIIDQIIGFYGHDGYDAETTASILNLDTKVVEQIIKDYDIEHGAY